MDEFEVVHRINTLAGEEHRLEHAYEGAPLSQDASNGWVLLRLCLRCGQVGSCDNFQPPRHRIRRWPKSVLRLPQGLR